MSIFSTKRRDVEVAASPTPTASGPRPAARSTSAAQENTHIAAGSRVVGEVSGGAELVIDGEVEGQIELDSRVVVGPNGRVQGEIHAQSVEVSGKVIGNIRGRDRVEVKSSGRLEGDVVAPRVVIDDGAFFKGKVEMTGGEKPASPVKAGAPEPRKADGGGNPAKNQGGGAPPKGPAPGGHDRPGGNDKKGGGPGR